MVLAKCLRRRDATSNNVQSSLSFKETQKANVGVKWIASVFISKWYVM